MRRLRLLVVLLILWLLFFFSIERFSAPVNISRVAYPFAPLMAIFVILVPGVRRTPLWALLVVPIPIFIAMKAAAGYRVWGTSMPLTVTEICAISVTTILARWISNGLSEFEDAVAHITIGQVEDMPDRNLHGQAEMYREVRRARRHQRPLSMLAIEIEEESIEVALHQIVKEAQQTLMKRYVLSGVARALCDTLEDYNLITQEDDHFLVILPETTPDKLDELIRRLHNLVGEQVGVNLVIGSASFPGDAVTFESLMEKARKDASHKLKSSAPSSRVAMNKPTSDTA
jgi:hypothetical protein